MSPPSPRAACNNASPPTSSRPRKRLFDQTDLGVPPTSFLPSFPFPSGQANPPVRPRPAITTGEGAPAEPSDQLDNAVANPPPAMLLPPLNPPTTGLLLPILATQWTLGDFAAHSNHKNYWVVSEPIENWHASAKRLLREGGSDTNGGGYAAVVPDEDGRNCLLGQKRPNREDNGYIQIQPSRPRGTRGNGKAKPYGAHQLICLLSKRYASLSRDSLET
jgi:hypothetical protein